VPSSWRLGAVLAWSAAGVGLAQQSSRTEAETLFRQGREMLAAHRYAEACDLFERSQKADPGLGTLLNLAGCYQDLGRTASAWKCYQEADAWAKRTQQPNRERIAATGIADLERRLSRLRVVGPQPRALSVDGVALDVDAEGLSAPVDPGKHQAHVTAGGEEWSGEVELAQSPGVVSIPPPPPPVLETPAPVVVAEAPSTVPTAAIQPPPSVTAASAPQTSWQSNAGKVLAIGGAVFAAGGGAGIGYCWYINGAVKRQQPGGADFTSPTVTEHQYAQINLIYPLSMAAAVIGVIGIGGGLYLTFSAPSASAASVSIGGTF
jgi:hypothetical protein